MSRRLVAAMTMTWRQEREERRKQYKAGCQGGAAAALWRVHLRSHLPE
jgi:hypothetical protein